MYDDVAVEAIEQRLKIWIRYYNSERLHAALGNKTPEEWKKEHQFAAYPPSGDFLDFSVLARLPSLRSGVALRATRRTRAYTTKSKK